MTTVLLVDDQELVRAGFRIILQSEPGIEVIGEASNGADGVALARSLNPDVICMDVQMPGMDGLEATRMIVADDTVTAGVLMLTTFDRDDYLFEALQAGASGFLLKTASPEHLIDAVQVVARGDALLSPSVTRRVIAAFAASSAPVIRSGSGGSGGSTSLAVGENEGESGSAATETVSERADAAETPSFSADRARLATNGLTDREREVLALLASGFSNAEIAARLFVGEATVKTHVSKVLLKLGLRDRIQAVIFAYEHGVAVPGA